MGNRRVVRLITIEGPEAWVVATLRRSLPVGSRGVSAQAVITIGLVSDTGVGALADLGKDLDRDRVLGGVDTNLGDPR